MYLCDINSVCVINITSGERICEWAQGWLRKKFDGATNFGDAFGALSCIALELRKAWTCFGPWRTPMRLRRLQTCSEFNDVADGYVIRLIYYNSSSNSKNNDKPDDY